MSSSNELSSIFMSDDAKKVQTKINKYAFSGGRESVEEHRKHGGDPDVDVSYQYLKFFLDDDEELDRIAKVGFQKSKPGPFPSERRSTVA